MDTFNRHAIDGVWKRVKLYDDDMRLWVESYHGPEVTAFGVEFASNTGKRICQFGDLPTTQVLETLRSVSDEAREEVLNGGRLLSGEANAFTREANASA